MGRRTARPSVADRSSYDTGRQIMPVFVASELQVRPPIFVATANEISWMKKLLVGFQLKPNLLLLLAIKYKTLVRVFSYKSYEI